MKLDENGLYAPGLTQTQRQYEICTNNVMNTEKGENGENEAIGIATNRNHKKTNVRREFIQYIMKKTNVWTSIMDSDYFPENKYISTILPKVKIT